MKLEKKHKERLTGGDILKAMAALFVVCIHTVPFSESPYIVAICRTAVPLFFLITGYFYPIDSKNQKNQIIKTLKLTILTFVIYTTFYTALSIKEGNSWYYWIEKNFDISTICELFIYNKVEAIGHLWYLLAMLYTLIFFRAISVNMIKLRYIQIAVTILLVVGTILSFINVSNWFYRNWLFEAVPFIGIGILMKRKKITVTDKYGIMLLILGIVTLTIEAIFSIEVCTVNREYYLSNIMIAVVLLMWVTSHNNSKSKWFVEYIGREYSPYIYIFHLLIIHISAFVINYDLLYIYIRPIIVYSLTVFAIFVFHIVFKNKISS